MYNVHFEIVGKDEYYSFSWYVMIAYDSSRSRAIAGSGVYQKATEWFRF